MAAMPISATNRPDALYPPLYPPLWPPVWPPEELAKRTGTTSTYGSFPNLSLDEAPQHASEHAYTEQPQLRAAGHSYAASEFRPSLLDQRLSLAPLAPEVGQ
jgi:hypothetical protein